MTLLVSYSCAVFGRLGFGELNQVISVKAINFHYWTWLEQMHLIIEFLRFGPVLLFGAWDSRGVRSGFWGFWALGWQRSDLCLIGKTRIY